MKKAIIYPSFPAIFLIITIAFEAPSTADARRWGGSASAGTTSMNTRNSRGRRYPKSIHYQIDDMSTSESSSDGLMGSGREFDLFNSRGGGGGDSGPQADSLSSRGFNFGIGGINNGSTNGGSRRNGGGGRSSMSSKRRPYSSTSSASKENKSMLSGLKEWIQAGNLPKLQCRVEPNTTLKVRKTFRPLKTVVKLGADFNTQLGVWQFKSSWEDDVIGGKLTLAGRELQFSKTWLLSVGAVEDLVTRLRMRAAVDLGTMKAYARLGFRTERLSPINVVEGFTLMKRLPLDGNDGHVKLEVKANFAFPEPEIEYSTENHRSFVGMGDIEVNIDELNLLLDY
eukprot:CAMPEP_0194104428 /NCGR_PEP_ID=MMETSP0150-20130528/4763_1 /TAXON_ID=122233 /ORGANISM="Chaetoceros debilis, Strain MM31A-1" /LENGTH=339 /DNA_ID=CAMNT_0038791951 /DNA_START=59 /DNA_END=1081 /DNA_ORIENTATION=-